MKIKSPIVACIILLLSHLTMGQSELISFNKAFKQGDLIGMSKILDNWSLKVEEKNNPELVICQFNYHLYKAEKIVLFQTSSLEEDVDLFFVNAEGKPKGTVAEKTVYDPIEIQNAEEILKNGIKKFPDRLDMRFGLITLFKKTESWIKYTESIIECLNYSLINDNNLRWINNTVFEGANVSFLKGLDDFQGDLFASGDDALLPYMRLVAEEIIKRYPNHLQAYFDVAIIYVINNQYDDALSVLLAAEKKFNKNQILLGNIAFTYKSKGDIEQAIYYYKKVLQCGDREHVLAAQKFIIQLQK